MKDYAMAENERPYSTTRRPRKLTDAQIAEILDWHRTRMNGIQIAARYGISTNTLKTIVRTSGAHYKQASPEKRRMALRHARTRHAELFAQHWL